MKNDNLKVMSMKKKVAIIAVVCLVVVLFVGFTVSLFSGIIDAFEYEKYKDNPLKVTAVVTKHDLKEDDTSSYYYARITYTVDGVLYENVSYQREKAQKDLPPIGKQVFVSLNPADPSELMSSVYHDGFFWSLVLSVIIAAILFLVCWLKLYSSPLLTSGVKETRINAMLLNRVKRVFRWLIFIGCLMLVHGIYLICLPSFYKGSLFLICVVCTVVSFFVFLYQKMLLKKEKRIIVTGRIFNKYIYKTENDGVTDLHYRITAESKKKKWSIDISKNDFDMVCIGDIVEAVYVGSGLFARKPTLCFYNSILIYEK